MGEDIRNLPSLLGCNGLNGNFRWAPGLGVWASSTAGWQEAELLQVEGPTGPLNHAEVHGKDGEGRRSRAHLPCRPAGLIPPCTSTGPGTCWQQLAVWPCASYKEGGRGERPGRKGRTYMQCG